MFSVFCYALSMKIQMVLLLLLLTPLASGQKIEKDNYSVPKVHSVHHSSGTTARSMTVRAQFLSENPCPATGQTGRSCPGYVVDHVVPLACGGADDPSNMQFQTVEDGKAKDKWERKGCGK